MAKISKEFYGVKVVLKDGTEKFLASDNNCYGYESFHLTSDIFDSELKLFEKIGNVDPADISHVGIMKVKKTMDIE